MMKFYFEKVNEILKKKKFLDNNLSSYRYMYICNIYVNMLRDELLIKY